VKDDLNHAADLGTIATQKYYDWVKQMLSLSFAALTALVALQGNYRPDTDLARYLLWGTFASLAASVIASAIVLRGESHAIRHLSRQFAEESQQPSEYRKRVHVGSPPAVARLASLCLPWALSLSVLCLFAFSVVNSFTVREPLKTIHQTSKDDPRSQPALRPDRQSSPTPYSVQPTAGRFDGPQS
jgi:hypothetical protein